MDEAKRPKAGETEERTFEVSAEGKKIRGKIPYGVESRDLGGFTEIIEPTALRSAKLDDLVAVVDHAGVPLARYPTTLELEDRSDGMHWSLRPPESRQDVREAVERGDLRGGSWRMVVAKDEWRGDTRHVHEISELRDVSVVTTGAYPAEAAPVELRSRPEDNNKEDEMSEKETEERSEEQPSEEKQDEKAEERSEEKAEAKTDGLKVEDRAEKVETMEDRDFGGIFCESIQEIKVGEVRSLVSAGNALSPTDLSTALFQTLRASSIALRSGIPVLSTDKEKITWPKLSADVSPAFYSEGGTITPGDPTFVSVTSEPQKIAHITRVSNELIDDSDPDVIVTLSEHLSTTMALKLDAAVYTGGTALPGITGLTAMSGVQSGGTIVTAGVAGTAGVSQLMAGVGLLRAANAPEPYVLACNPNVTTAFDRSQDTTGQPLVMPFRAPTFYSSTQITAGTAFLYSPSQFAVVSRTDASVEVDRSRLFNSDESEIRGKVRANFVPKNSNAAVKLFTN